MSSVEPIFDKNTDTWYDINFDIKDGKVILKNQDFENYGDVDSWLTSEAFDLDSTRL